MLWGKAVNCILNVHLMGVIELLEPRFAMMSLLEVAQGIYLAKWGDLGEHYCFQYKPNNVRRATRGHLKENHTGYVTVRLAVICVSVKVGP